MGITGTPTFVIGTATGESLTGVMLVGARPYAVYAAAINTLLADD